MLYFLLKMSVFFKYSFIFIFYYSLSRMKFHVIDLGQFERIFNMLNLSKAVLRLSVYRLQLFFYLLTLLFVYIQPVRIVILSKLVIGV